MKILTIIIAVCSIVPLFAESKMEKDQRLKIADLETKVLQMEQEAQATRAIRDQRETALKQENARLVAASAALPICQAQVAALTEAQSALQSQLRVQAEASKVTATAVKAITDGKAAAAATASGVTVKLATERHAENIQELKKGTSAAEEAAEHARQSARWSQENHDALVAAIKQIGQSASDVSDLKRLEVQNGHAMTIVSCATALSLAFIGLLFYLRGRNHGR